MLRKLLILLLSCHVLAAPAADSTIVVLADSLSASYGIDVQDGWVARLQQRLASTGYNYRVVNASISGDTTSGAAARLDELLRHTRPDLVIIELGGNDGLRGLPVEEMYRNLSAVIERLQDTGAGILLLPMQLPPNYGPRYNEQFQQVYERLAAAYQVVLGRFILDGIGGHPELMQPDGIHPRASAQQRMLDNVWPYLEPMLVQARAAQ